jgi:hypothetical protein
MKFLAKKWLSEKTVDHFGNNAQIWAYIEINVGRKLSTSINKPFVSCFKFVIKFCKKDL